MIGKPVLIILVVLLRGVCAATDKANATCSSSETCSAAKETVSVSSVWNETAMEMSLENIIEALKRNIQRYKDENRSNQDISQLEKELRRVLQLKENLLDPLYKALEQAEKEVEQTDKKVEQAEKELEQVKAQAKKKVEQAEKEFMDASIEKALAEGVSLEEAILAAEAQLQELKEEAAK